MKKSKILCALSGLLLLASCSNGGGTTSSISSSSQVASSSEVATSSSEESVSEETSTYDPYGYSKVLERRIPCYNPNVIKNDEKVVLTSFYNASALPVWNFDNSTIPYVEINTYINEYMGYEEISNGSILDYKVDENDCYDFVNEVRINNPTNGTYVVIDFDLNTATYYGYSDFFATSVSKVGKRGVGSVYGSNILPDRTTAYEYYEGNETYTINFGNYNFGGYIYKDQYFLPLNLISILLGNKVINTLLYENDSFFYYSGNPNDTGMQVNEKIKEHGTSWIDDTYKQYTYDSLALFLDNFYGLDERQSRVEAGKTITYELGEGKAYAMLEPYKEKLFSTEPDVSCDALLDLFKTKLDDGGHTSNSSSNIFGTKTFERIDVSGSETINTFNTMNGVLDKRKEKGIDIASNVAEGASNPNGYYKEYNEGTIAYIQFDEFIGGTKFNPSDITDENYFADSDTLFYYANEKIQNNPNIKDVVIDLSANGGGLMYASEYIASWACGGNDGVMRNTKTNSFFKYRIEADINFDGKFDEKDYLSKDINLYVMISNSSFSCGNKLPCNIADNRKENTFFIGSQTGGGSCAVLNASINYFGSIFRVSSTTQIGRINSTQDNFISNEEGISASKGFEIANDDYDAFTNLDAIMTKIVANRNHD